MGAVVGAVGWLAGLHWGGHLPALDPGIAAIIAIGFLGLGAMATGQPLARLASVAVALALLGAARGQLVQPDDGSGSIAAWADRGRVTVQGVVEEEPEPSATGARVVLAVEEVVGTGGGGVSVGRLRANIPSGDWRPGDRLAVTGVVTRPVDSDALPMAELLSNRGIWATMASTQARKLDAPEPSLSGVAQRTLSDLRRVVGDVLDARLPAPTSALAKGLLLGGTAEMPAELVDAFRRAGLTHVVAVSGYNVGLVTAALLPFGRMLGGRAGLGLAALAVALFTVTVGAPASAVRAASMASLALLARYVGRPADATTGLAIAAVAMTAIDPRLLYDLGFQLSSLATLGLIAVYPWLSQRLGSTTGPVGALREALAATLAVEALTLPLIAVLLGQVALLSPVANLLALPAVPAAMLCSFLVVVAGPLPAAVVAPLSWVAWAPLAWIIVVAEAVAGIEWSAAPIGTLGAGLAWGYYAVLGVVLLTAHARSYQAASPSPAGVAAAALRRVPTPLLLAAGLLAASSSWAAAFAATPSTRITFFEESGSALIQTSAGGAVLVDPGSDGRVLAAELGRALPFWRSDLDLVLVGRDAAPAELERRHRTGQVVTIAEVAPGTRAALEEGTELGALPGAFALESPGARLLLVPATADQAALAEYLDEPVDVLWLGRGAGAPAPLLLERAAPSLVVQHVARRGTTARVEGEVLRSDERGTVEIELTAEGYEVRSRR